MDSLLQIIKSYSEVEKLRLRKYITRKSNIFDRKDLLLLDLLSVNENYTSKEIAEKIYGYYKKDAYHQLRKVLYSHIENFEVQQNTQSDIYNIITRQLTISKFMFNKNLNRIGWKYLLKAEDEAIKAEQFNLLNHIYYIQQENSFKQYAPDIYNIIQKRNKNLSKAKEDINLNIVLNVLRYNLRQTDNSKNIDLNNLVNSLLKKYGVKKKFYHEPKLAFSIFTILSRPLIERKEYHKYEKFIMKVYNELQNKNAFQKHNHYEKLRMLQLIINIKTKLKKFQEAENFVLMLEQELLKYKGNYHHLIVSFMPAIADLYNYQGNINKAIETLENILDSPPYRLTDVEVITYQLNLASLYFQNKDFLAAKFALQIIEDKNKIIKYRFGIYRLLIKYLTECIICFELNEHNKVKQICTYINRNFRKEFNNVDYEREKIFIKILLKLNKKKQILNDFDFINEVINFTKIKPFELGEIEVISFNDWLISKIKNEDYYTILLKTLN